MKVKNLSVALAIIAFSPWSARLALAGADLAADAEPGPAPRLLLTRPDLAELMQVVNTREGARGMVALETLCVSKGKPPIWAGPSPSAQLVASALIEATEASRGPNWHGSGRPILISAIRQFRANFNAKLDGPTASKLKESLRELRHRRNQHVEAFAAGEAKKLSGPSAP